MARVLLIGTFETKTEELAYLDGALRGQGLEVESLDVSLGSSGAVWPGARKLEQMTLRAEAAAGQVAARCRACQMAIGVGGGTGAEIVLAAMRGLPSAFPKLLITTLAFDPRPALADTAITIIPTLCDIEGLNASLRQVFENAAAAAAGLTRARRAEPSGRPSVAITTLGVTGRAGTEIARGLGDLGFETTVFHANGYGGAAFSRFVAEGKAQAVVDMNVHELGRIRLAGACVPMPDRFTGAGALPRVILPGALNFIGLGAVESLSAKYLARPHYRHTAQFTHVRLTPDEMAGQAGALAELLNRGTAPCQVIVPMGGFSHEDRPGGAIEDAGLRQIAAEILEREARAYTVARVDHHINTPQTAQAAVTALQSAMSQKESRCST